MFKIYFQFLCFSFQNERIWDRIVDKEQCLKFDMELDVSKNL